MTPDLMDRVIQAMPGTCSDDDVQRLMSAFAGSDLALCVMIRTVIRMRSADELDLREIMAGIGTMVLFGYRLRAMEELERLVQ